MTVTDQNVRQAKKRMAAAREAGFAVKARYDRGAGRIVVELNTGVQLAFPAGLADGLAGASQDDLSLIEISPAGLGLHWPKLDADVYVPGLLQGVFGAKRSIAAELGAAGGRAQSRAKADAARENGRKGGRPRKRAQDDPALAMLAEPARSESIRPKGFKTGKTRGRVVIAKGLKRAARRPAKRGPARA
jgi:hypothetical protein